MASPGGDRPRRVLMATRACYLDDSNGASVASRNLMECLARKGWQAEVLCGPTLGLGREIAIDDFLSGLGLAGPPSPGSITLDASGVSSGRPVPARAVWRGIPITIQRGPTAPRPAPDPGADAEFLSLLDDAMARLAPSVLVGYGGDRLACETFRLARSRGVATAFVLHNFQYDSRAPFADVDEVLVPSSFAAGYYLAALGLRCTTIPNLVDPLRAADPGEVGTYLTFVNPSREKGVWAFARIADELGRRRPDIPILVVESRGTEATVASCGLDLRAHGNVFFMGHAHDPRRFWRRTRACLMPSLWSENQPLAAIEALMGGIPVVGSDRGGLPEALGSAGVTLPLPSRLTPSTAELPDPEEVGPWVEEVIRLWDDPGYYAGRRARSLAESARWASGPLEARYDRLFGSLPRRTRPCPPGGDAIRPVGWAAPAQSWQEVPGFFDFAAIYDEAVARAEDGAAFVEVGTLVGRSTCYLATKIRESGKSIALYAVDTCRGSPTDSTGREIAPSLGGSYAGVLHRNILGCGLAGVVVPIVTESVRAAALFADESLDFCFIDADHAYESVLADLAAWWPKVRPGGTIAGHDYRRAAPWLAGVSPAVDGFFGVADAQSPLAESCWSVAKPRPGGAGGEAVR